MIDQLNLSLQALHKNSKSNFRQSYLELQKHFELINKTVMAITRLLGIYLDGYTLLNNSRVKVEIDRFNKAPGYKDLPAAFSYSHRHDERLEVQLFWLKKKSKSLYAWIASITNNYEDMGITSLPVGIDIIISPEADSIFFIVSKNSKVRVLEFKELLTHTQESILNNWKTNIAPLTAKEITENITTEIHALLWKSLDYHDFNKQFYSEIQQHFKSLAGHLHTSCELSEKEAIQLSTRLIGRLLFIWFLHKKELINQDMNYFDISKHPSEKYFYHNSLEVLFFSVLNSPPTSRDNQDYITPYLNGGLFEPQPSDHYKSDNITFPKDYFQNIFTTFNRYNFTIDENTADYQKLAIDPEMLGNVFEQLLAEEILNPTQNRRSQEGAFYTPKEVVNYICEQTLINHLNNKIPNCKYIIDDIVTLPEATFRAQDKNYRSKWKPFASEIYDTLIGNNPVKILDPAVGSGAFPMGMLQLLIKVITRIKAQHEKDIASLKKTIIAKCLFGIDINQQAVEICRIRVWLTLAVEIKTNTTPEPLPNLDFKFICANSLVAIDAQKQLFYFSADDRKKLIRIMTNYYEATDIGRKNSLKKEFLKIKNTYTDNLSQNNASLISHFDPFDITSSAKCYDPELMHGVSSLDIIIGNPPYIPIQKLDQSMKELYQRQNYKSYSGLGDIYCLFYERGINLLTKNGLLTYITSNKWLRSDYGKKLRNLFKDFNPQLLINLGQNIFPSATVDTAIFSIQNSSNLSQLQSANLVATPTIISYRDINKKLNSQLQLKSSNPIYIANDRRANELIEKIKKTGNTKNTENTENTENTLGSISDIVVKNGIKTGLNEAFYIDQKIKDELCAQDPSSKEIIEPILKGRHIHRYYYQWKNTYIINTHNGVGVKFPRVDVEKYKAIKKYLDSFEPKLSKRGDKGHTQYNLRDCAYLESFSQPKIVWSDISTCPTFTYIQDKKYVDATVFMITGKYLRYLTGLLNSSVTRWFYPKISPDLGDSANRYKKCFLLNLPIPHMDMVNKTILKQIEALVISISKLKQRNPNHNTVELERQIDELVFELYSLTKDEIKFLQDDLCT